MKSPCHWIVVLVTLGLTGCHQSVRIRTLSGERSVQAAFYVKGIDDPRFVLGSGEPRYMSTPTSVTLPRDKTVMLVFGGEGFAKREEVMRTYPHPWYKHVFSLGLISLFTGNREYADPYEVLANGSTPEVIVEGFAEETAKEVSALLGSREPSLVILPTLTRGNQTRFTKAFDERFQQKLLESIGGQIRLYNFQQIRDQFYDYNDLDLSEEDLSRREGLIRYVREIKRKNSIAVFVSGTLVHRDRASSSSPTGQAPSYRITLNIVDAKEGFHIGTNETSLELGLPDDTLAAWFADVIRVKPVALNLETLLENAGRRLAANISDGIDDATVESWKQQVRDNILTRSRRKLEVALRRTGGKLVLVLGKIRCEGNEHPWGKRITEHLARRLEESLGAHFALQPLGVETDVLSSLAGPDTPIAFIIEGEIEQPPADMVVVTTLRLKNATLPINGQPWTVKTAEARFGVNETLRRNFNAKCK